MANNKIEKLLKLLEEKKLDELKNELTHELLLGMDKTKANLFMAVKNYLKKVDKCRPILQTINHKNNKQFICNGTTAFIFDEYRTELDELPNTTNEDDCLNIFRIIATNLTYDSMSDDDKLILKNIKKYTAFYKARNEYNGEIVGVYWNGCYFDANVLTDVANVYGNEIDELQVTKYEKNTQLKTKDITAIVLPLNDYNIEQEQLNKIKNTATSFIAELKGI